MDQIPEKYIDKCLAIKRVFDQTLITFFVTLDYKLIESKHKQIVNMICLKEVAMENGLCEASEENTRLKIHFYDRHSIVLLLLIEGVLIVLTRKSEIDVFKVYKNVKNFKVTGQRYDSSNKVSDITVIYDNGDEEEVRGFHYTEQVDKKFKSIENQIKVQQQKLNKSLQSIRNQQKTKLYALIGEQKFLPRLMRLNDVDDVSPLVRFGSIFTRLCNEKVVIGVPIFNNSSLERRVLLENLRLIIGNCSSIPNIHYKYDLYKMKTECPSFEAFEELFDSSKMPKSDVPAFDQEWKRERSLYANEAGVFVVVVDMQLFVNEMSHRLVFNISYEINAQPNQIKLVACIGETLLKSSSIFSRDLDITSWDFEKYKNLLAITSTAEGAFDFQIKFEEHNDIENFLRQKLHFDVVRSRRKNSDIDRKKSYAESHHNEMFLTLRKDFYLYCSNGYFTGVLIRLNLQNDLLMKAKIYVRAIHQLLILMQAIYSEYANQCTIELKQIYGHSTVN